MKNQAEKVIESIAFRFMVEVTSIHNHLTGHLKGKPIPKFSSYLVLPSQ